MPEDQTISVAGFDASEQAEDDKPKVIWGDGKHQASVTPTTVVITRIKLGEGTGYIQLSRAEFRELVLGWQRQLLQEEEEE
jgi:hypothetical protein